MVGVPEGSRIDAGRMRAAAAKRAVALAAAGGFVVAVGLARHTHPGAAAARGSSLPPPARLAAEVQGSSLGAGAIAPSGAAPQAQTATS